MTLFSLDSVRNGEVDHGLEPALQNLRHRIAAFNWPREHGSTDDILEAFDFARPRLNVLVSLLRDAGFGKGIDVSTGLGFLPALLTSLHVQIQATEREPRLAAFAASLGVIVHKYEIGSPASLRSEQFDFVIFAEVLEHLKLPPQKVLKEVASLVGPGGSLLLTTPNIARLSHIEALAAGENFLEEFPEEAGLRDATDFIEHVREYSVREVVEAMEGAGLEVQSVLMTGWGTAGYRPLPNPYANEIIIALGKK